MLLRFLDEFLDGWRANMRPGLRFCRVWSPAEVAELGSALAETIRSDFDAVFAVADEPALSELTGQRTVSPGLGAPYRQVPVTGLSGSRDPFSVDPALVERGLRGHTDTQNELASVLSNAGIDSSRGLRPGPDFDLAWQKDGTVFVAEVKSITAQNEEHQLRLGLWIAPASLEAFACRMRLIYHAFLLRIVVFLVFFGGNVLAGGVQALGVIPVNPF